MKWITMVNFELGNEMWIESPLGFREVMGSIPFGDSGFFLSEQITDVWFLLQFYQEKVQW